MTHGIFNCFNSEISYKPTTPHNHTITEEHNLRKAGKQDIA